MNENNDLTNFHMDNSEHEVTDTKELTILSLITVSEGACKTEFYFERCRIKNLYVDFRCEIDFSIVKR